ncbi:hypothetical protein LguiB_021222 [Lonicera macranthoides]
MSFKSATTAATDIHSSTSSSSETTTWRTSSSTHLTTTMSHPHPSGYPYWDSIRSASGQISLSNLYFLHRLNAGDISSVLLLFDAMPMMPCCAVIFTRDGFMTSGLFGTRHVLCSDVLKFVLLLTGMVLLARWFRKIDQVLN